MRTTETTVQITPETDLREVLKPGDRVRIEFEVGQVQKTNITVRSGQMFTRTAVLHDYPITIIRPAEPTIAEQIEALEVGARFVVHTESGTEWVRYRTATGFRLPGGEGDLDPTYPSTATRIEVLG